MELGNAETVSIKDHHQRGIVDIHAHFDDSGGNQDLGLIGRKRRHGFRLHLRILPSVQGCHWNTSQGRLLQEALDDGSHRRELPRPALVLEFRFARFRFAGTEVAVVVRSDLGAHHIDLVSRVDFLARPLPDAVSPTRVFREPHHVRGDRGAPGGKLVKDGGLKVTEHSHGDGTRNGSCRHHQQVGRTLCFCPEGIALLHPEAVLLIDHNQAEILETRLVTQQGMRADDDPGIPGRRIKHCLLSCRGGHGTGQQGYLDGLLPGVSAEHACPAKNMVAGKWAQGPAD
ncbi:hypothetical protein PJL18_03611 [Paenarthrobacter nicotinovorans]|nr:hypothetical protein [Paenarthrobacter nicotinovorans]